MGSWPLNAVAREENNATAESHDDCGFDIMARMVGRRLWESLGTCILGAARKAAAAVEVHVSTWTLLSTARGPSWPVPARGNLERHSRCNSAIQALPSPHGSQDEKRSRFALRMANLFGLC
jgi:hypothetical protein